MRRIALAVGLWLLVLLVASLADATHCGADTACWEREAREGGDTQRLRELDARERAETWNRDVEACRQVAWMQDTKFQAHVPSPLKVKILGTATGRYEFSRCMDARGHDTRGY